jgi:peroxiredoxin
MTGMWLVAFIALWILFLLLAVVTLSLLRNVGTLADAIQQLQHGERDPIKLIVGEAVPELALTQPDGTPVRLTAYHGTPRTLYFISPGCGPCHELIRSLATTSADRSSAIIVSMGSSDETQALLTEVGVALLPVLFVASDTLLHQWGIRSTPTTVELDADGQFVRHTVGFTPVPTEAAPHTSPAEAVAT